MQVNQVEGLGVGVVVFADVQRFRPKNRFLEYLADDVGLVGLANQSGLALFDKEIEVNREFDFGYADAFVPIEHLARQDITIGHRVGQYHRVFDGFRRHAELDLAADGFDQPAAAGKFGDSRFAHCTTRKITTSLHQPKRA